MAKALRLSMALAAMLFVSQANAASVSVVDENFFFGNSTTSIDLITYNPDATAPVLSPASSVSQPVAGSEVDRRSPWQWTKTGSNEHGDDGLYTSVQANGSGDIVFATLMDTLQLAWGSPDSYNILQFFNDDSVLPFASIIGSAIEHTQNGTSIGVNFVTLYIVDGFFNKIRFLSPGQNAFEFANVRASNSNAVEPVVPLPAGLILLLSGLTGLGFLSRARAKSA